MPIEVTYATQEEIPAGFESLYTEKGGKWELTEVKGIKTEADVTRVQTALSKERADHKKAKEALSAFGDLKPDEVLVKLDRINELEELVKGKPDDTKINEMVETRIKARIAPLEREKANLAKQVTELTGEIELFKVEGTKRTISETVRAAASKAKLLPEAIDDALMFAERVFTVDESGAIVVKEGVGFTVGINPEVWLTELQPKRPHWWGSSIGGGGKPGTGGGGVNPFTHENWNMTEQGRMIKENRAKAEQMAKSAGTTIGGGRPKPKTK